MARHTFLGDVIDPDDWQPIQDQLAAALRMELHLLGPDGNDLCQPSRLTSFRRYLNGSSALRQAVPSSRREFIRRSDETRELVVDRSMTYRLHFSVPILFADEHIATVYGGGTVPEPLSPQQLHELSGRFNLDLNELTAVAAELPVADEATVAAAAKVIQALLTRIVEAVEQSEHAALQAARMEALARVGQALTALLDLLRVLDAIVDAVPRVMDAKAAAVALVDQVDGTLRIRVGAGVGDDFLRMKFAPGQGLFGWVLEHGQPVSVPEMAADPRNAHAEIDAREGLRALLAVPLRHGSEILGVIGAFHGSPHHFTGEDERLLEMFADYAASAVYNARLFQDLSQANRELVQSNRLLHEAQDRLFHSEQLAQLGLVAGGAAHEMKNTLGGIIGAASVVRDKLGELSDDDVRELLAGIAEECWQLRDSIETIRQHAKPVHYGLGWHRVAEIVGDAVRLLRFDSKLMGVTFETDCPDQLELSADRDRLKTALVNLLRNAAEAAQGLDDRRPRVVVRAHESEGIVSIAIEDNGRGIPAAQQPQVWDAFFTTKGESGTGLGLETVRQVVLRHGGEITLTSEVGVGTTFTIHLPQAGALEETT